MSNFNIINHITEIHDLFVRKVNKTLTPKLTISSLLILVYLSAQVIQKGVKFYLFWRTRNITTFGTKSYLSIHFFSKL